MRISEAFPSEYLKAADLQGREFTLIIREVRMEDIGDGQKPIVYFTKTEKGLVLNRTNANTIATNLGTDDMDLWKGKAITLFSCQVDFQGRQVEAIRIRLRRHSAPQAPRQVAPPLPPADEPPAEMNPSDEDMPPF